jgi:D-beta-D-heptose 7-phosphate kinase/D-beta-D-heptose 1-phosphate adenosyltransferase
MLYYFESAMPEGWIFRKPHTRMSTYKIEAIDSLAETVRDLRARGKRVVFTNGCFDLLHKGHIELFRAAREHGDVLVVAINTDESVRRLKGPGRPVFDQSERAEVLIAMEPVDFVCVFDEDTPLETILKIHPDVLVKGSDWVDKGIVGQEEVEAWGGEMAVVPLIAGQSSTGVVERVLSRLGKS